jgi:hypothetical protein
MITRNQGLHGHTRPSPETLKIAPTSSRWRRPVPQALARWALRWLQLRYGPVEIRFSVTPRVGR